jgi:hypothetical protein
VTSDFDLNALYSAIDEQRVARGLSWAAAVREMSGSFVGRGSRALAVSTVTSLRTKAVAEGDGVLAMLRWLDRTPESFVPGSPLASAEAARLPDVRPLVLRMDTNKLHGALNAARVERGLTWEQLAREIRGATVNTLTGLASSERTGFPNVMWVTGWLGKPLASFTRATRR